MLSFAKIIYDIWHYAENEYIKPNPRNHTFKMSISFANGYYTTGQNLLQSFKYRHVLDGGIHGNGLTALVGFAGGSQLPVAFGEVNLAFKLI